MSDPEPPVARRPRLGRAGLIAMWLALPLVALALRERSHAKVVEAVLDERITALQLEIAEGRDAAPRREELAADVDRLESEVARVIPCDLDMAEVEAEVRGLLEPLGVHVDAPQRRRRRDFYDEHPIVVTLPRGEGVVAEVVTAIEGSRPFKVFAQFPSHSAVFAFQWECDDAFDRSLPYHGDFIPGRTLLTWPFDRGVEMREQRIATLRDERDRNAEALRLSLRRRRLLDDLNRRQSVAADITKRAAEGRRAHPLPSP